MKSSQFQAIKKLIKQLKENISRAKELGDLSKMDINSLSDGNK